MRFHLVHYPRNIIIFVLFRLFPFKYPGDKEYTVLLRMTSYTQSYIAHMHASTSKNALETSCKRVCTSIQSHHERDCNGMYTNVKLLSFIPRRE